MLTTLNPKPLSAYENDFNEQYKVKALYVNAVTRQRMKYSGLGSSDTCDK